MSNPIHIQTTGPRKERIQKFAKQKGVTIKTVTNAMVDYCMPQFEDGKLDLAEPKVEQKEEAK